MNARPDGGATVAAPPSRSPCLAAAAAGAAFLIAAPAASASAPTAAPTAAPAGAAPVAPVAAPVFDPVVFFAGATQGVGSLRIILHRAAAVRVRGRGTPTPGGGIVLDQLVERAGRPAETRQWRLRPVAPGRWVGTLSDARGPVAADSVGPRLHIAYRAARGGVAIEQWLTLAPDGLSARNRLVARKLGVVVARLDEEIRRLP